MLPLDTIYNEDCLQGMRRMGDGTERFSERFCRILSEATLVYAPWLTPLPVWRGCSNVCDPPYLLENRGGGFWSKNEDPTVNRYNARGTRKGMDRLGAIKDGITEEVLDEMCRVMKRVNIYIFCSQRQIQPYLDYFVTRRRCNWNLLCWHIRAPYGKGAAYAGIEKETTNLTN